MSGCYPNRPGTPEERPMPPSRSCSLQYCRSVQDAVVEWWRVHHRKDLPWRRPSLPESRGKKGAAATSKVDAANSTLYYDPYQVWVSEVMSQQTRMETVIPYYAAWMKRFPSVEVLAAATEDEVKAVWAGMGYYRRAMYLRKGAQYLREWSKGQKDDEAAVMPKTQQALLKVPGIGPYTSAAIASQCFGEAVCSVDGNVVRVLSRLRGVRDFDPKVPANVKEATIWGQELIGNSPTTASVVCRDPSAFNQGLMELGASVCRPSGTPLCSSCPLQQWCRANELLGTGEIDTIEGVIPVRASQTSKRLDHEICVVHEIAAVSADSTTRFVVVRRPSEGLLAGMLEFPTLRVAESEASTAASTLLEHPLSLHLGKMKTKPISATVCGSIRHIFSHILLYVEVAHVVWPAHTDGEVLIQKIVDVLDERLDGGKDSLSACDRVSLKTEEALRKSAPSRLMLKILSKVRLAAAARTPIDGASSVAHDSEAKKRSGLPRKKVARLEEPVRRH